MRNAGRMPGTRGMWRLELAILTSILGTCTVFREAAYKRLILGEGTLSIYYRLKLL